MSPTLTNRDSALKAGVSQSPRVACPAWKSSRASVGSPASPGGARRHWLHAELAVLMRGIPMDVVVDNLANPFYQKLSAGLAAEVSRRQQRLMVWVGADMGNPRPSKQSTSTWWVGWFPRPRLGGAGSGHQSQGPWVLLTRAAPHRAGRRPRGCLRGFHRRCESGGAAPVSTVDGQLSYDGAYEAAMALLARELWLVVADLMAFAVLDAARAQGMAVPGDLWVVSFNGVEMPRWSSYDLAMAIQPLGGMVSAAVDLLLRRVAEPLGSPSAARWTLPPSSGDPRPMRRGW